MAKLYLMLRLAVVVTLALHSAANPLPEPNPDPLPNPLAGLAALDNRPAIIEIDIPSSQAQVRNDLLFYFFLTLSKLTVTLVRVG